MRCVHSFTGQSLSHGATRVMRHLGDSAVMTLMNQPCRIFHQAVPLLTQTCQERGRRKSRGWNGGLGGQKKRLFGVRLPALRLLGTPSLSTRLGDSSSAIATRIKNFGVWGVHAKHNQAMQHHAKSCHAMQKPCKKLFSPAILQVWPGRMRQPKKNLAP